MKTSDEALEAMEAFVRRLAKLGIVSSEAVQSQAAAIVKLLPEPVDPDLVEAREVLAAQVADECPVKSQGIREGKWDAGVYAIIALAALKRGRELEREGK